MGELTRFLLGLQIGRLENIVGWYHSHPGYGCWLSGIDVQTQMTHQTYEDPFLAVVVRPLPSPSSELQLSALSCRSIPTEPFPLAESRLAPSVPTLRCAAPRFARVLQLTSLSSQDYTPPNAATSEYQSIPLSKIEDFGVHANSYYPLEISHFKSSSDAKLLDLLWNKYWVMTLSQSPLISVRSSPTPTKTQLTNLRRTAPT